MKKRTLLLASAMSFAVLTLYGQGFDPGPGVKRRPSYPFRAFLNKFSVNLSSGYGYTFYRHDLAGYNYVRNDEGSFITPQALGNVGGYSNWFSEATPATFTLGDATSYKIVEPGEESLQFRSGGYSIPINLSVYYNLFRVRLGGGIMADFHRARQPEPDNFLTRLPDPSRIKSTMLRYYFLLGYSAYEYYDNAIGVDVRVGSINMGKGFDESVIEASPAINVGVTLEKVFSEYFRVYLRPAYEFKSYTISLPDASVIDYRNNAFFVTLGVSINYPEMPRSPIKNDKTQMRHYVSDGQGNKKEFRGQPFWKKQDPKIGELYPELIKSKRKRGGRVRNVFKKPK